MAKKIQGIDGRRIWWLQQMGFLHDTAERLVAEQQVGYGIVTEAGMEV